MVAMQFDSFKQPLMSKRSMSSDSEFPHEPAQKKMRSGGNDTRPLPREVTMMEVSESRDASENELVHGQELPPGDVEEEDDRFFGGGLTLQETEALDYLDAKDNDDLGPSLALDPQGVRKMASRFDKIISKNQTMRARYVDEPIKFLETEAELDQETKGLSVISEYPNLFGEFVSSGCLASLISLFAHENNDIACSAIQVLDELTEEDTSAEDEHVSVLVQGLKDTSAIETLAQNLTRLDEAVQEERDAIFKSMSIVENIINLDSTFATILSSRTKIWDWLMARINKADEVGFPMSENRQYAAELISILLQSDSDMGSTLIDNDAIDSILMLIAPFRKRDPEKGSTEEEFLENLFDILDILVTHAIGKDKFIEGEGVELMQRLLIDAHSRDTRLRALRNLEYACASWLGGAVCQKVVEVGLLKTIFSLFMRKDEADILKACLGIQVSFFRTLNDGEEERLRVLNKFTEKEHSKIVRLLEIRAKYAAKHDLQLQSQQEASKIRRLQNDEDLAEYQLTEYLDRMEIGLDVLQLTDTILAWLLASNIAIKQFIATMTDSSKIFDSMKSVLQELANSLPADMTASESDSNKESFQEREMIEAILDFIPAS